MPDRFPPSFPKPARPFKFSLRNRILSTNGDGRTSIRLTKARCTVRMARKGDQAHVETDKIPIMLVKRTEAEMPAEAAGFSTFDLVAKARNGDRTAFHGLVDQFQPEIYRMMFYRTHSLMDAEDLTQDVMLRAYKHIRRLKSPEVFRSWLYRIAVNRVKDYYRRKQFKSLFGFVSMDQEGFHETDEMALAPEVDGGMSKKDFWKQIGRMLTRLSAVEKEVFLLRFFDQLTIKEMSAALHKSESTIKTHLYRALRKFKAVAGQFHGLREGL